MEKYTIDLVMIKTFEDYLENEEKSALTIAKYLRDLRKFQVYLGEGTITKELVIGYKDRLTEEYAVSSVNSMLAAINHFFTFMGWHQFRVKQIKQQRQVYCPEERDLTKKEYYRLIDTARVLKKERLGLILQSICSTGIRISELKFLTVKAAYQGVAYVDCKGKCRQVFLPKRLRVLLLQYVKKQQIKSGPIFITKHGKPMDRSNIWREMKNICRMANVMADKVFPHNLRHLFAKTYYNREKDISKLADLLGHSSINTTRIYTITSGLEHRRQIERMCLIL